MFAALWDSQPDGTVVCRLCAHRCRLRNGAKGICGVRVNMRGKLVSLVSQIVTAVAMDPVEKKPLYHFLPGSKIFSVGSAGCNFSCKFCQNSNIAHVPENGVVPGKRAAPEDLLALAQSNRAQSMAFTYNEPTVFFELMYETAGIALKKGIRSVLVTNAARFGARFMLKPPRPPHWGGFRLQPDQWEFWQGRKSRLHDRLRYTQESDQRWLRERLAP